MIKDKEFVYKEVDQEGMDTLDVISQAGTFNRWMYNTIRPYNQGTILEIGSGVGNISQFFVEEGADIYLTDIRDSYCDRLKERFPDYADKVKNIDLVDPDFDSKYAEFLGFFDSVYALNVVEHIKEDGLSIRNAKKLLKPGGKITILVPAYMWLYNKFDEELYHYRRYNRKRLVSLIRDNGFSVDRAWYFNLFGILGWFVTGSLLKRPMIPGGQMKIYDMLVPIIKHLDWIFGRNFGLSVIVTGTNQPR